MGVTPSVWGPILWGAIHLTCLAGSATPEFIHAFADALPCPSCSQHFKELLNETPFPSSSDPLILFEWSVNIHNKVNARIGKPVISVEQALKHWTAPKSNPSDSPQFDFKIILLFVLLIFLIFMLVKNK